MLCVKCKTEVVDEEFSEDMCDKCDDEEQEAFMKAMAERPCSDCGKKCRSNYSIGGKDKDGNMRKACMSCKKKDWEKQALRNNEKIQLNTTK